MPTKLLKDMQAYQNVHDQHDWFAIYIDSYSSQLIRNNVKLETVGEGRKALQTHALKRRSSQTFFKQMIKLTYLPTLNNNHSDIRANRTDIALLRQLYTYTKSLATYQHRANKDSTDKSSQSQILHTPCNVGLLQQMVEF